MGHFGGARRHVQNALANTQAYQQAFGPSQTTPLAFSNQYPSTPSDFQSMGFPDDSEATGDMSNLQLHENYNFPPNNSFGVTCNAPQMQWRTHAPHIDTFLDPVSPAWGLPPDLPSAGSFNFNTERNGQYGVSMTRQNSIASSAVTDFTSPLRNSTPSQSMRGVTDSPSPALLDQIDGMHECQWQLDQGHVCGLVFEDVSELNSHVSLEHVKKEQPSEPHGYVCRWVGCTRQTSDHCEGKRGFEGRSKLSRHIRIHTGSGTYSLHLFLIRD